MGAPPNPSALVVTAVAPSRRRATASLFIVCAAFLGAAAQALVGGQSSRAQAQLSTRRRRFDQLR